MDILSIKESYLKDFSKFNGHSFLGVDSVVGMWQHKIAPITTSIGTFGLGDSICVVAKRGNDVLLAHYPPLPDDIKTIKGIVANFKPEKTYLFTTPEWIQINGKFVEQQRDYGIVADVVVSYSEIIDLNDPMSNTLIVKNGEIIAFGGKYKI